MRVESYNRTRHPNLREGLSSTLWNEVSPFYLVSPFIIPPFTTE
jgi:hypothetical protein